MILVAFRGCGEWFYRESDSIRLAIKRTTKKPYRKPSNFGLKDIYCPDYDDWLGGYDNTDEKFSEWVELFEDSRKEIAEENYKSEDHEYNSDLKGIFVRDPSAKGDVYDTGKLRCLGANYIDCLFTQGIFRLNDEDEEACKLFSFEEIKDDIKFLLPCSHVNSAFIKKVSEGELLSNDAHRYYFEIQDEHHRDFPRSSSPRVCKYTLKLTDSRSNTLSKESNNKKRIELLEEFIEWLEGRVIAENISGFRRDKLECTKDQLFLALKKYEALNVINEGDRVYNLKGTDGKDFWKSCAGLWGKEERIKICDVSGSNKYGKNGTEEHIFKKIRFDIDI